MGVGTATELCGPHSPVIWHLGPDSAPRDPESLSQVVLVSLWEVQGTDLLGVGRFISCKIFPLSDGPPSSCSLPSGLFPNGVPSLVRECLIGCL